MQPQNTGDWQQPQGTNEYHAVIPPAEVADAATEGTPTTAPIEAPAPEQPAPEDNGTLPVTFDGDEELIRWQATEYTHREHAPVWYIILGVVVIALMALAIFVIKSITFSVLIPVMAAALIVYTRHPPAVLHYVLSRKGLHINDKLHPFEDFRAFSIIMHGDHNTILLIPRKRFAIAETLYFPDEVGEPLVDLLAARLPLKDGAPDIFDRIIARLHL